MWIWLLALGGLAALALRDNDDDALGEDRAQPNHSRGGAAAAPAIASSHSSIVSPPRPSSPSESVRRAPRPSRRFDALLARYAGSIPLAYLRALAHRESSMNPAALTLGKKGIEGARGLLQVTPIVRHGFNRRHGTRYTADDLYDPETNVRIATDELHRILAAYQSTHPDVLGTDWRARRFVELVTAGWNAGWSKKRGVMRVVAWLKLRGLPIDVDHVHRHATDAGAIHFLALDQRLRWWKSVADLYLVERARERIAGVA